MLREIQHGVDHSRDEFLRVALIDALFLASDPVFEVAGFHVLVDLSAAVLPGIIGDAVVSPGLPELCREPCGDRIRC